MAKKMKKYASAQKRKAALKRVKKSKAPNNWLKFLKMAKKYGFSQKQLARMYKARKADNWKSFIASAKASGGTPIRMRDLANLWNKTSFLALDEQGQAMDYFIQHRNNPASTSIGILLVAGFIGYCIGKK